MTSFRRRALWATLTAGTSIVALAAGPAHASPTSAAAFDPHQQRDWTWESAGSMPELYLYDLQTVFDESRGQVVLVANDSAHGSTGPEHTWIRDGASWKQLRTEQPSPSRYNPTVGYDALNGEVVYFGGSREVDYLNDTWVLEGDTWVQRSPKTSPPKRYAAVTAYDPVRERLVLFGGLGAGGMLEDTWTWNGKNWRQIQTRNDPPGRYFAALAFDPATGTMLLTGGVTETGRTPDTWSLDGKRWKLVDVADDLVAGFRSIETVGDHVVLVGGSPVLGGKGDVAYVWSGRDWDRLPARGPAARHYPGLVYDSTAGEAIMFGGRIPAEQGSSDLMTDTWTLTPPTG